MATKDPETPGKFLPSQSKMSDDFILPIAPPASPSPSRAGSGTKNPPKKLPEVRAKPSAITVRLRTATQPLLPQEPSDGPDAPLDEYASNNSGQPKSNSLVAGLSVAVAAMLVVIVIQHKSEPELNPPAISSSSDYEIQLAKARADADAARRERARIAGKISGLEEQLESTRNAAKRKEASLLEEYNKLSRIQSELISENSKLKSQLQAAAQPTKVPELPRPAEKAPAVQQQGQSYRVAGLRPGDTLNIRSGPGTNYSIITALPNDVKVTVTGDAVMNGPDAWLPCVITLSKLDTATGIKQSWDQKCWINSYFVEPASN
jgi:Bacterial SH3 domain